MSEMPIEITLPESVPGSTTHHVEAAKRNVDVTREAMTSLRMALAGETSHDKILLRAAAGAGKSYALLSMVADALESERCSRVAVTAFANKQVFPLAGALGQRLGAGAVCLFIPVERLREVPDDVLDVVTVAHKSPEIPPEASVVVGVSHKLGARGEHSRLLDQLGASHDGERPFDALFVDEAWQLPLHRYSTVEGLARVTVGVGDVGQLPPIDPGHNPWRGDPGYNPYRAWPTAHEHRPTTHTLELPSVWRPTAAQLPLWRAFYPDWAELTCVAAPGDRAVEIADLAEPAASVWTTVASGTPTLIEIDGLATPDAPDIDEPLLAAVEALLEPLFEAGFVVARTRFDGSGAPQGTLHAASTENSEDPLIVVLATRNQAVDDATSMVERLVAKFDLPDGVIVASTVDSWQGRTNAITVAVHPLSGTDTLDDFNSAFGRLAVTCTRATHGLLMVARAGLDQLLDEAPARPGTPLGEPGTRALPRQTHHRILATFARGTITWPAP